MHNLEPIEEYKKKLKAGATSKNEISDENTDEVEDDDTTTPEEDDTDMMDDDTSGIDDTGITPESTPPAPSPVTPTDGSFTATPPDAMAPALPPSAGLSIADNSERPYMVITNLKKIADQANQLLGMIQTAGKVEQWAVDHITTSSDDVEEVYNYYKYSGK